MVDPLGAIGFNAVLLSMIFAVDSTSTTGGAAPAGSTQAGHREHTGDGGHP